MEQMRKNPMILTFVIYFGVLSLLRWNWNWGTIGYLVGGIVGMGLVWIERLYYVYVTRPHEHLSEQVKHLVALKRFRDAGKLLIARKEEQQQLVGRSVLFMALWVPLSLFVVTSTSSMLAQGLMMGAGLQMLMEIWGEWGNWNMMRQNIFWPIKREVSVSEIKTVVYAFGVAFGLMTLISI